MIMDLFIFISAFLIFLLMVAKTLGKSKHENLPPGPKPLPIVGNMPQLLGSLPHRILADLAKKYGPLMYLQLGEVPTVFVSTAEAAKEVMNEHDIIFANRPFLLSTSILNYNCQDIAFSPYGDYWRQLRKICTVELLSSKRVQTFRSIREEEVSSMIKSIASREGSVVNLSEMIYLLTYDITAQAAFGKRSKHKEEFVLAIKEVVNLMGGFNIAEMYPSIKVLETLTGIRKKLERTHQKIDMIVDTILREHRDKRAAAKPGNEEAKEDLVDVLLNIQKSGQFGTPLADDNLKAVIYVSS